MPVRGDGNDFTHWLGNDFIRWLGRDMSIKILMCLEDPSDLVRVSTVSRLWRQFGKSVELKYRLYYDLLRCLCTYYLES